jgi:isorenieratene synthase
VSDSADESGRGLTRRGFLTASLAAGGLVSAGGAGAAYAGRARIETLVAAEPDLPPRVATRKRVVIAGGGLAGLSAGLELAERGFEVELFEAGSGCGGRVGGWTSSVMGEQTPQEHGFHGVFFQYVMLRDLIARYCDPEDFLPLREYPLAIRGRPIDTIYTSTAPFPFNALKAVIDSKNLSLVAAASAPPDHALELLRYDPIRTFERWDGVSFEAWCKEMKVAPSLWHYLYDPYARAMFSPPDEMSAAEMLGLFHSYFIANPTGMGMSVFRRASPESLIDPLVKALERLGGKVHMSAPIHALHLAGNRVAGVVRRRPGPPRRVADLALSELPEEGYTAITSQTAGVVFVGRRDGEVVALSGHCTHQGCPVAWRADERGFLCPCHGGRYDALGRPIAGPPKQALPALFARSEGDRLVIETTRDTREEVVPADYVILAADVKGVRQIARNSTWPAPLARFAGHLGGLGTARPYCIARMWLDKPVREDRKPLYTAGGFDTVDEFALFSQYQDHAMEWARRSGGSVVESHCYALDHSVTGDPQKIAEDSLREASTFIPELEGARILHTELQLMDNFTAYAPGAQATRPRTGTPVANLLLAGDWVRIDYPLELMERAVTSGRLAANRVLGSEGVRRVEIRGGPPRGLLA